jgi:hypothetical protein
MEATKEDSESGRRRGEKRNKESLHLHKKGSVGELVGLVELATGVDVEQKSNKKKPKPKQT